MSDKIPKKIWVAATQVARWVHLLEPDGGATYAELRVSASTLRIQAMDLGLRALIFKGLVYRDGDKFRLTELGHLAIEKRYPHWDVERESARDIWFRDADDPPAHGDGQESLL